MKICRLCLKHTKSYVEAVTDDWLISKIKECVSVEILPYDDYPSSVCNLCLDKINIWFEFKTMCLQSKSILEAGTDVKGDNLDECIEQNESNFFLEEDQELKVDLQGITSDKETETNTDDSGNDCNSVQTYNCDFCDRQFEYLTDYLDHQLNDHDGESVFKCEKCNLTFTNKLLFSNHEKSHKIPCNICGKHVQKQSMKLHLIKHTDRFKCPQCALTFTCAPILKEHITAIHLKLKQFFCDVCGKAFSTKSSLLLHLKIHSDEKSYKCSQCEYAGRTSISLKIHMSKHENSSCMCEYCPKIFKSNRNLYDHLKRVHRAEKKHACDVCNMKFALRYLLEKHKRTHTGVHPYKCTKCLKTFSRSDSLKEHMKTHNRTEIFVCPKCNKKFFTKRGFQRHKC